MQKRYAENARVYTWGGHKYARRVSGLTKNERAYVRNGGKLFYAGAPEYQGKTERVIIARGDRFYTRMPN